MAAVAEKLKQVVPKAFQGDGVGFMRSVYRDPSRTVQRRQFVRLSLPFWNTDLRPITVCFMNPFELRAATEALPILSPPSDQCAVFQTLSKHRTVTVQVWNLICNQRRGSAMRP